MIFLQDKHNINAASQNIKFMYIRRKTEDRLREPRLYSSF
jgi:hypothetical protein